MRTKKELVRALSEVALFEGLAKRELGAIVEAGKVHTHAAGKVVVEEDSQGVALHVILDGKARVSARGRVRARLGAGDYFGEISVIDRGPRTATVKAETDLEMFSLTSWAFWPLLEKYPSMGRKLLVEVCRRLRENEKSLTH